MWVNLYQKKIILSVQTMMLGYFSLGEAIFTPYLLFCQFFPCCFLFLYFMQCFVHTFPTFGVSTVSSKRLWVGSVPNLHLILGHLIVQQAYNNIEAIPFEPVHEISNNVVCDQQGLR